MQLDEFPQIYIFVSMPYYLDHRRFLAPFQLIPLRVPNTKNKTIIWSGNSTPVYISKKNENTNLKKYMHLNFTATLFATADMEAALVPTNRWMAKEDMIYVYDVCMILLASWYFFFCIYISRIELFSFICLYSRWKSCKIPGLPGCFRISM